MKELRLHEGELNVMELLWSNKELAAKDISKIIKEYIGWEILGLSAKQMLPKERFRISKPELCWINCTAVPFLT